MAKNFRSTREFREAMLEALGTTQDKDVENEANYKSALLEALGVEHTRSDVVNFETFREKLVEGVTNYSGGSGGGGESDFSTAEVTFNVSVAPAVALLAFISSEYNDIEVQRVSLHVGESTYTIPLYKNGQYMIVSYKDGTTPVITGDVTYEGNEFAVTGDCTISVEGEPLT